MSEQPKEPTRISDADWQRIGHRISSAMETGIAIGKEQALHSCDLRVFDEGQLHRMILKTTRHLPVGRELLTKILDDEGVAGLHEFMQQVNASMREDGVIDLEDLKMRHQQVLHELQGVRRLKNPAKTEMSRRDVISWGIAGLAAGAIGKNAVIGVDKAFAPSQDERVTPHGSSALRRTAHQGATMAEAVAPTIEVGLAAVVLFDALRERTQEQKDQIVRAITLFSREARKGVQGLGNEGAAGYGR